TYDFRIQVKPDLLDNLPNFQDATKKDNFSKPTHPRPELSSIYVAPTNDIERKLANLFQELLGIEQVGIHDSFFALGGDSLIGTVLISQLRKNFQIEVPVDSLFEAPTVSELALVIEEILIEELERLSQNVPEYVNVKIMD
ncbi:MAG: phosphopantetheine-binding protein, partial [Nostoc sp.]